MRPGATALTLMRRGATSSARDRVKVSSPAFRRAVSGVPGAGYDLVYGRHIDDLAPASGRFPTSNECAAAEERPIEVGLHHTVEFIGRRLRAVESAGWVAKSSTEYLDEVAEECAEMVVAGLEGAAG
jgi:hypothetical protein